MKQDLTAADFSFPMLHPGDDFYLCMVLPTAECWYFIEVTL